MKIFNEDTYKKIHKLIIFLSSRGTCTGTKLNKSNNYNKFKRLFVNLQELKMTKGHNFTNGMIIELAIYSNDTYVMIYDRLFNRIVKGFTKNLHQK